MSIHLGGSFDCVFILWLIWWLKRKFLILTLTFHRFGMQIISFHSNWIYFLQCSQFLFIHLITFLNLCLMKLYLIFKNLKIYYFERVQEFLQQCWCIFFFWNMFCFHDLNLQFLFIQLHFVCCLLQFY